ncbi:MAG TPA: non-homologous end-joining DNA ligase [Thermoanaerobaculia bacterium]|nr:non-homologous end-joining DNA ligase [Thermoanaerobaculia bacterium]
MFRRAARAAAGGAPGDICLGFRLLFPFTDEIGEIGAIGAIGERFGGVSGGLGAAAGVFDARKIGVMRAGIRERPFSQAGWLFELKYDGFRIVAGRGPGGIQLGYRSGRDATPLFPELVRAVGELPFASLLLDGEVVMVDGAGRPSFQDLQRRAQRRAGRQVAFFAFDLLACEGFDLRPLPLRMRKELLRKVLAAADPAGPLRYVDDLAERGEELYAAVRRMGLEGIVAKRADSPYRAGPSTDWLKVRADLAGDFAVIGFEPRGPSGLRRLHLAARREDRLAYAGTVGTGWTMQEASELRGRLYAMPRVARPAAPGVARSRGSGGAAVWLEPALVCEVRYKQWTDGRNLRQPVFLRLRDDKTIEECELLPAE